MKKILMILALLSGCAQVPVQPIVEGANLLVTRASQLSGGGVTYLIYVDNDAPVMIDRGQTRFFKLPDGSHILRAKPDCSCPSVGGNSGGYPVMIGNQPLHLTLFSHIPGTSWIPIVGLLSQEELNFVKAKD